MHHHLPDPVHPAPRRFRRTALWQALALAAAGLALAGQATAQTTAAAPADAAPAAAAPGEAAPAAAAAQTLDSVVVTGTRQLNRTVADSLSPIQLLSADTLEKVGKLGLQEALSSVLPSFTLPSQAGGNLTSITRIATLRGLNPDHVLVLVNGKRRHPTSIVNVAGSVSIGSQGVDLNMIPLAAIQRIEVLTDGAAAQYGSDAIAGVINIIMKTKDSGGSLDVAGGKYFDGDGLNGQANLNQGIKLGVDGGFLNLSASLNRQQLTNRAINGSYSSLYYAGDPRNDQPVGIVYKGYGIPESTLEAVGFNAALPFDDSLSAYAFGTYSKNKGKNWVGFRPPKDNNNVIALYPDGFVPRFVTDQQDYGVTAGVKGASAGWNWDLSTTYGDNLVDIMVLNSVNPTYGTASPRDFYVGSFKASEWTTNLDVSREWQTGLFFSPLNVAFGIENRRDTFAIGQGQPESYLNGGQPALTGPNAGRFVTLAGTQSFPGFRPEDELSTGRSSTGAYVDLEADVTRRLRVGVAGRFEHYSDFGNDSSGKLSLRYEVSPSVALRGAASNGFRAPSLGQQYYSASATAQYQGRDYNIANLPVNSAAAVALGAQPLKPEKSQNLSLGVVLKPMAKATLAIDAYRIGIKDRIVQSANIGLSPSGALDPGVATLLRSKGILGIDAGRFFLNGVDTTTTGADIVGTYTSSLAGWGSVAWTLAANFNKTKIDRVLPAASQTLYSTQIFNQVAQDQLTMTTPRNKFVLSADWTYANWHVFLRETRYGQFTTPSTTAGGYSHQTPKYVTDLELGYAVTRDLQLAIGAQNLFNKYPDKTNPVNFNLASFNGAQIYNSASPFGLSGGNYYARLSYSWN